MQKITSNSENQIIINRKDNEISPKWTVETKRFVSALAAIAAIGALFVTLAVLFPEVIIPFTVCVCFISLPFLAAGVCTPDANYAHIRAD